MDVPNQFLDQLILLGMIYLVDQKLQDPKECSKLDNPTIRQSAYLFMLKTGPNDSSVNDWKQLSCSDVETLWFFCEWCLYVTIWDLFILMKFYDVMSPNVGSVHCPTFSCTYPLWHSSFSGGRFKFQYVLQLTQQNFSSRPTTKYNQISLKKNSKINSNIIVAKSSIFISQCYGKSNHPKMRHKIGWMALISPSKFLKTR